MTSNSVGSLQITPENLLSVAMPIHTLVTWFCIFGVSLIIISTLINFKKQQKIIKPIKLRVLIFFTTSFLCLFIRGITWSIFFSTKHCNIIKYFYPTLYLLQKSLYYEFLIIRLETTFARSIISSKKTIFYEKIWCLKAYNITQCIFFITWMLISTDVPIKYKSNIWGLWCEEHYKKSFIIPYVTSDAIYSIVILLMYVRGLNQLIKVFDRNRTSSDVDNHGKTVSIRKESVNEHKIRLKKSIVVIAKTQTILCSIAVGTTIVFIGVSNVIVKPLSWFSNVDLFINCLCVYLMFKFVRLNDRIRIAGICCWCWCCWPFNRICWSEQIRDEMEQELIKQYSTTSGSRTDKSWQSSDNSSKTNKNNKKRDIVVSDDEQDRHLGSEPNSPKPELKSEITEMTITVDEALPIKNYKSNSP